MRLASTWLAWIAHPRCARASSAPGAHHDVDQRRAVRRLHRRGVEAAGRYIGLQVHGGLEFVNGKNWVGVDGSACGDTDYTKRFVRFRNVRLKELK